MEADEDEDEGAGWCCPRWWLLPLPFVAGLPESSEPCGLLILAERCDDVDSSEVIPRRPEEGSECSETG